VHFQESASFSVGFQILLKCSKLGIKNHFGIQDLPLWFLPVSQEHLEEQLGSFC
jgi:hypothetical protein